MNYGILRHIGYTKSTEGRRSEISIGDVLECLVIRNIYASMGVEEDKITTCYQHELPEYDGEYVVLPINVYEHNINYSDRVLPVFLGLTLGGDLILSEREINYIKKFAPVGCRDERTMRRLRNLGIDAYLQGCLVATFGKRPSLPTQNKVFFVNCEGGIKDYIPEPLLENYEFVSHDYYVTENELYSEENIYELGERFIQKYTNEAKLVVTSKYHSAILCLALGIPVIMIIENNYYKYTWIEKFIPIYEPKDYANINWNPDPVCIPESEKELMLSIARRRISETFNRYNEICTLSEIRERQDIGAFSDIFYGNYAIEYVKENWDSSTKIDYAFWGVTETATKLNAFIAENYRGARLRKVFDYSVRAQVEYKEGVFVPEPLSNIANEENKKLFIFVTGNSAYEEAMDLFEKLGREKDTYFLCHRVVLLEEDIKR